MHRRRATRKRAIRAAAVATGMRRAGRATQPESGSAGVTGIGGAGARRAAARPRGLLCECGSPGPICCRGRAPRCAVGRHHPASPMRRRTRCHRSTACPGPEHAPHGARGAPCRGSLATGRLRGDLAARLPDQMSTTTWPWADCGVPRRAAGAIRRPTGDPIAAQAIRLGRPDPPIALLEISCGGGDRLDLDEAALRQGGDLDRRAGGRRVGDEPAVHLVDRREVGDVGEEDRGLRRHPRR